MSSALLAADGEQNVRALQRDIRVMDQTAFSLCRDNDVTMRVFGMEGEGNVASAILGEQIGTLVTA